MTSRNAHSTDVGRRSSVSVGKPRVGALAGLAYVADATKIVARNLRTIMDRLDLDAQAVAKRMGIATATVYSWTAAARPMTLKTLGKLAEKLEVSLVELISDADDEAMYPKSAERLSGAKAAANARIVQDVARGLGVKIKIDD